MKVYLVVDHDYESDEILGVYATRSGAEHARKTSGADVLAELLEKYGEDSDDSDYWDRRSSAVCWHSADIDEHEVRWEMTEVEHAVRAEREACARLVDRLAAEHAACRGGDVYECTAGEELAPLAAAIRAR